MNTPPTQVIDECFLSLPLTFTEVKNKAMAWSRLGDILPHLDLDLISLRYVQRCRGLLHTHLLFEFISPTTGRMHVLPYGYNKQWERCFLPPSRLSFEYTFDHTLFIPHYNYLYDPGLTPCERIYAQCKYPIGFSCGTFYRSRQEQIVLVSPSVPTVGHILTEPELHRIDTTRCSFVECPPGYNPVPLLTSTLAVIPNEQEVCPSYLLVSHARVPFWMDRLPPTSPVYLLSIDDLQAMEKRPTTIHALVIDYDPNEHYPDLSLFTCHHMLLLSSNLLLHMDALVRLSKVDQLPFPPLDPLRDLCVFLPVSEAPTAYIEYVCPEPGLVQLHKNTTPTSTIGTDRLLRACAGITVSSPPKTLMLGTDELYPPKVFADREDTCVICLCPHQHRRPVVLPCGHVFCRSCIMAYTRYRNHVEDCECPTCRAPLRMDAIRAPAWDTPSSTTESGSSCRATNKLERVCTQALTLMRQGKRPCIITAHQDIVKYYATMLQKHARLRVIGFAAEGNEETVDVIICHINAYNLKVYADGITDILVSDFSQAEHQLSRVLYGHKPVTLYVHEGCMDAILCRQLNIPSTTTMN